MKRIWISLLLILCHYSICAQYRDSRWVMGYGCCVSNYSGIDFDFRSGSLQINAVNRGMNFSETNGVMCNESGDLLFYSNGVYIANAMNDTMLNGSGLNPSDFTTSHSELGLTIPQANLVLPIPGDSTRYYLFHETVDDRFNTYSSFYLYYSIIDMTLDNGLGAVTLKNQVLLNDSLIEGRLTAVRHANGRDWWVVSHKFRNGLMYKFLVTPQGISGPYAQDLITPRDNYFGQALFSVNGDKFAYYDPFGDLDIWYFNRCTGNFSNLVHVDINDSAAGGGAAFSRSGRYLYVSSVNYLYQFDLQAANVSASQLTVGVYDGFRSGRFPANFYLAALAPDNKIYVISGNSSRHIHVINNPDSAGLACDFCQHCIPLPASNAFTIPNFPNYYLGQVNGSACDTLTTAITDLSVKEKVVLFPNPVQRLFYVAFPKEELIINAFITDAKGMRMEINYRRLNDYLEFDTTALQAGIYSVTVITTKKLVSKKFVKL